MPHIATKINCDGDKCGECEYIGTLGFCDLFRKYVLEWNRLPECLAGELVKDCTTCGHKQGIDFCDIREVTGDHKAYHFDCWDHGLKYWQPATKGERYVER